MKHQDYLRHAVALAQEKMQEGAGGPFGAVIVMGQEIIAQGWNQVTSTNDPTAHAEITAIRTATKKIASFSLTGGILYSSCEPCPMCLAAAYWARLDGIVFANTRAEAAAIGFDDEMIYRELALPNSERLLPITHMPLKEAALVFQLWESKTDKIAY